MNKLLRFTSVIVCMFAFAVAVLAQTATSFSTTASTVGATVVQLKGAVPANNCITYQINGDGCAGCTVPAHGTISQFSASNGTLVYTPTAGYLGADSFSFSVKATPIVSGQCSGTPVNSTQATVSITVTNAKTPISGVLTNQDGSPRKGTITFFLTQQTISGDALIPGSSSVSSILNSVGRYSVQVYPSRSLSPQAYYQVKFKDAVTGKEEPLGVYDIPASTVTLDLASCSCKVTDANLAARYTFLSAAAYNFALAPAQKITVSQDGTFVGTQPQLNFGAQAPLTATISDNGANNRVDLTFGCPTCIPTVQDEGSTVGPATTFNFVGAGVTASVAGNVATITIPGGGGGGGGSGTVGPGTVNTYALFTGATTVGNGVLLQSGTTAIVGGQLSIQPTGNSLRPLSVYASAGLSVPLAGFFDSAGAERFGLSPDAAPLFTAYTSLPTSPASNQAKLAYFLGAGANNNQLLLSKGGANWGAVTRVAPSGSSTIDKLVKFSATGEVTDSIISQSGTNSVSVAGGLEALGFVQATSTAGQARLRATNFSGSTSGLYTTSQAIFEADAGLLNGLLFNTVESGAPIVFGVFGAERGRFTATGFTVTSNVGNDSGLTLANLTDASPATNSIGYLAVNSVGKVVRAALPAGAGGGAPVAASYLTLFNDPTLTNESVIGVGTGLSEVLGTGAYTLSIDQAAALNWTAAHTYNPGTASVPALSLTLANRTTNGATDSHKLLWQAKTREAGNNHTPEVQAFIDAVTNDGTGYKFSIQTRLDGGAWSEMLGIDPGGFVYGAVVAGNSGKLATTTGALTAGRCVEIDANANFVQSSGGCGAGGATSVPWSGLTNPSADKALAMGNYLTTMTWGIHTNANDVFTFQHDIAASSGSLVKIKTITASNVKPLRLQPRGVDSFLADHLGNVIVGVSGRSTTDTDGWLYLPTVAGTNVNTPTAYSSYAPLYLDTAAGTLRAYYAGNWNAIGGGGGSSLWSALGNPTADLSLSMAARKTVFTWGNATGAGVDMFTFTDTLNNTGTGDVVMIYTASGSAAKPLTVTAQGTANGVQMSTAGALAKLGTGSIIADAFSGTLPVANGGTGQTSATNNGALIGNGSTFALSVIPDCSNGTTSKLLYNNTTRAFSCGADQTGAGGGGITSFDGATQSTQTVTDDTNVTWTANTSTGVHALGWTGTLAKARQNSATVYNDQSNTFTAGNVYNTGVYDFGGAGSLKVPTSGGAAPTANGLIAYDSTGNAWKVGVNGTAKTLLLTDGNGAALTNLNASALASGTVPLAQLSGITSTQLSATAGITNAQLAGSIAYSKLSLVGSIVNTDIATGAAIAYSKLNLTGAILNADLAGSIADSKLATISTAGKVADSALSTNVTLGGNTFSGTGAVVRVSTPTLTNVIINQAADGNTLLYGKRATDTSPTGNLIQLQNAAASSDLFKVDVAGSVTAAGTLIVNSGSSSTPGIAFSGNTSTGFYWRSGNAVVFRAGGVNAFDMQQGGITLASGSTFGFAVTNDATNSRDLIFQREGAGILGIQSGTTGQTLKLFGTYANSGTDNERLEFVTGSDVTIRTAKGGTGSNRNLIVQASGDLYLGANSGNRFFIPNASGHFLAVADNTYDIGASGANRPRNVYVAGSVTTGGSVTLGNSAGLLSLSSSTLSLGSSTTTVTNLGGSATTNTVVAPGATTTLLNFAGTTSGFPALKRNGAGLDLRVGDDTAYANLAVQNLTINGTCTGCSGGTPAGSGSEWQFRNGGAFGAITNSSVNTGTSTASLGSGWTLSAPTVNGATLLTNNLFVNSLTAATSSGTTLQLGGGFNLVTINNFLFPVKEWLPFAACNDTLAATMWDLPTVNAAAAVCLTLSNTQKGVLQFGDSVAQSAQLSILIPSDWDSTSSTDLKILLSALDTTSGNTHKITVATACRTPGTVTASDNPTFNTAQTLTYTIAASTVADALATVTQTGVTMTGCNAGDVLHLKVGRDTTDTSTAALNLVGAELTWKRKTQ